MYGQVGQICDDRRIFTIGRLREEIRHVYVDTDPVDVLQAVAYYNGAGGLAQSCHGAQRRRCACRALIYDFLRCSHQIVQIAALTVQYHIVVTGQNALYRTQAVHALHRDLQRGQVNVHRVCENVRIIQTCKLHPEGIGDMCAVVADLIGRKQVARFLIEQHNACYLMTGQLNYIKLGAAKIVNIAVFQQIDVRIINSVRFFRRAVCAGFHAVFFDKFAQNLLATLVDINLCVQLRVLLAHKLMRHLHMVTMRMSNDQIDRLVGTDDLTRCLVQLCLIVYVKQTCIEHHCTLRALHQIHFVAVKVLQKLYARHILAVPVLRCAYLQRVVRIAGYVIVPACNTAGLSVLHRDRLDIVNLGDRTFLACGRLCDLDLSILIGFKLFALGRRYRRLVLAFRDFVVDVRAVLCGQRNGIRHIVVEYAQALGRFLSLGERICTRCRRCRRATGRTTSRATSTASGYQCGVVNLNYLAGDFAVSRFDLTSLAAKNNRIAKLCLT